MTAKEMLKFSIREHKLYNNENINYYEFLEGQLKDFIKQLCKEQRELCWREVYMAKYYTKKLTKIAILNTKQPEV